MLSYLTLLLQVSSTALALLLLALALLEKGLWDKDLILGWDRAVRQGQHSGCVGYLSSGEVQHSGILSWR